MRNKIEGLTCEPLLQPLKPLRLTYSFSHCTIKVTVVVLVADPDVASTTIT